MTEHAKHSRLSQAIAAQRTTVPCPAPGGCGGNCVTVHPRGIVLTVTGWRPMPPLDGEDDNGFREHYA